MTNNEILESCKTQLKLHIEKLLENGVRRQNVEIELIHYMKKLIYKD
jgi:hypothetical protein